MAIDKVTAAEFAAQMRTAVQDRSAELEVAYGDVNDGFIVPVSAVLERQNDRTRSLSLLISLSNETEFTEADVDLVVYNEGLTRSEGGRATGTVRFSRATAPSVDITIPRGFPVATAVDESTGAVTTFITTEAATLPALVAAAYFNAETARYEMNVGVIALSEGTRGNVGTARIKRPLRSLNDFDSVSNPAPSSGGSAREVNSALIERYKIAVKGRQLATGRGVERYIRDNYTGVSDVLVARGTNALVERAATDAGAVDAFILGVIETTVTDTTQVYLGVGQVHTVNSPPLISIESVIIGGTPYTETNNWEMVLDVSGESGSIRASEGIRFLPTISPAPSLGTTISITYTMDSMVSAIQADMEDEDSYVHGRDLLIRRADEVTCYLSARLRVFAGFSYATVLSAVQAAIDGIFASFTLGQPVEVSDLQSVVRRVSGVDNFIIDRLSRIETATGAADIIIADNEYARMETPNRVISQMT